MHCKDYEIPVIQTITDQAQTILSELAIESGHNPNTVELDLEDVELAELASRGDAVSLGKLRLLFGLPIF